MTIKNKQLENAPRVLPEGSAPATGAGKGSFFSKAVSGVVEAHYVDSNGVQTQITEGGQLKTPPGVLGEVNTAANLGSLGEGLFAQKVGVELQFKKIRAGAGITLTADSNSVVIDSITPAGGGEANTASNVGLVGAGVFKEKIGFDLRFRKIKAGSNVSVNYSDNGDTIEIAATGSGFGETNYGENLGSTGIGWYAGKTGEALQFKRILAGTNITLNEQAEYIEISASGTGSGEVNDGANLGAGNQVFAGKVGLNLQFRTLVAGSNVTINQTANEIEISASTGSGGEINAGENLGTSLNGAPVYAGKPLLNLQFKRIKAGSGIQITEEANNINIINLGAAGEANTGTNIGAGVGVYAGKSGTQLQFKSLIAGANVTINSDSDEITIEASGGSGDITNGASLGTGSAVFASKIGSILNFKSLKAGTNVTLTSDANEVTINASGGSGEVNDGSNLGTGEGIYVGKSGATLQFKSLVAGANITLTADGSEITIDAAGGGGGGETVKVSSADTLAGYLEDKVVAGFGADVVKNNTGGNENLEVRAFSRVFSFNLPPAATIAARIPLAVGLPAGWSLATADTAGDSEFSTSVDTLIITWDSGLGARFMYHAEVLQHTDSPVEQGWSNILSDPGLIKTKGNKTKGGLYLSGKGISTAKEIQVFVHLI